MANISPAKFEFMTRLWNFNFRVELWNAESQKSYERVLIHVVNGALANNMYLGNLTYNPKLETGAQYKFSDVRPGNLLASVRAKHFLESTGVKAKLHVR